MVIMKIDMDFIRSTVEQALQERDWQKESERVVDHPENKEELLGKGGNDNSGPYEEEPIKPRSKGAPPAG